MNYTTKLLLFLMLVWLFLGCTGKNSITADSGTDIPDVNVEEKLTAPDSLYDTLLFIKDTAYSYSLLDTVINVSTQLDSTVDTSGTIVSVDTSTVYDTIIYSSNMNKDTVLAGFTASWKPVSDSCVYYLFVQDSTGHNLYYWRSDTTFVNISGLVPQMTYFVRVSAYDTVRGISSAKSNTDTVRIRFPKSPSGLQAVSQDGNIRVSWIPNGSDYGIVGYTAKIFNMQDSLLDTVRVNGRKTSSAVLTVLSNECYKVTVVSIGELGTGISDSIYPYDKSVPADSVINLPYILVSTYSQPQNYLDMVAIKGGPFLQGNIWDLNYTDTDTGKSDGLPVHIVELSSFYVGSNEVTTSDYIDFLNDLSLADSLFVATVDSIDSSGLSLDTITFVSVLRMADTLVDMCSDLSFKDGKFSLSEKADATFPMINVTWKGSALYTNWRSERENLGRVYDSLFDVDTSVDGYRLPTEAEFEYVQSVAFLGSFKQKYPWGGTLDKTLYASCSISSVGSCGKFFGISDIVGNVAEWCHDYSDSEFPADSSYYKYLKRKGIAANPTGPTVGKYHIVRGGYYMSKESELISSRRFITEQSSSQVGFRIVRSVK